MRESLIERGPSAAIPVRRLKAFKSEADAFRVGSWFMALNAHSAAKRYCVDNGIGFELVPKDGRMISGGREVRAMTETINTAGGVLAPSELVRAVIALREQRGLLRKVLNPIPMASEVATIPKRVSGFTVAYAAHGVSPGESTARYTGVTFTAKKISALTRMSSELDQDALIDIAEMLAEELGWGFADLEDRTALIGDGTSSYDGGWGLVPRILSTEYAGSKVTAASGHDTMLEYDNVDLGNVIAALPDYAAGNAAWYCSQRFNGLVFSRLSLGNQVVMPDPITGQLVPWFMGYPIRVTSILTQSTGDLSGVVSCLFGDLAQAVSLGERRGFTLARSENGPSTFATDDILWKGSERVDVAVHDTGDATTPGAIVGLVGE